MIKMSLVVALDFERDATRPHQAFSYTHDGQWYICERGPSYANTYRVTEYDDDGLAKLLAAEKKEESTP